MTDTVNLGLPCIEGSQAQKHVTHNEALRILDTLVQLAVLDRDLTAPPGSETEGQRWIVKSGATGAWAGHDNAIAAWQDGAWQFCAPQVGWLAYAMDESMLLAWDGGSWGSAIEALTPTALNNMTLLGVGTTADAANPFSAKLNNTLFTAKTAAEGGDGDLRYKMNKEAAANTLSLLFQDNYSGRAEIGLTGDDDFHFKVSPDGTAWRDAIVIDKTTGQVSFPQGGGASNDLDLTLAQLALGVADALNTAQFIGASGNRFADSFDALTSVDDGAATNLDTDEAGVLKPVASGGTWSNATDPSLTTNGSNWGGVTWRQQIAAAAFAAVDGDAIRLTLTPPSSGTSPNIANVYIGHVGASAPDFDGNQVRVTFNGGNNGFTLTAGGASVVSDEIDFDFDHTKDLIIAWDLSNSGDARYNNAATNYIRWYNGSTGDTATTTTSGYTSNNSYIGLFDLIEVCTAPPSTNNMEVFSTALTAASVPSQAKLVARVNEIDSITLNTDLDFSVSRDGGTTWTNFAVTKKFTVNAISVYESDSLDISGQPSGTDVKWKATSANNKSFEIHDVYLYWS